MRRSSFVAELGFAVVGIFAIVAMGGGRLGLIAAAVAATACVVSLSLRR